MKYESQGDVCDHFFQVFMIRLMELIGADHSTRVSYERRELALEYIVQVTDVRMYMHLCLDTPVYMYIYTYIVYNVMYYCITEPRICYIIILYHP